MFTINICYDKDGDLDTTGIKFNNCEKHYSLKIHNEDLNEATTPFVLYVVLKHVGL